MSHKAEQKIEEERSFPLRFMKEKGSRYLACPYELTEDNLTAEFYNGSKNTVHFEVTSPDGFLRHFLYSRAEGRHLFTASGYLFTSGDIDIYAWKTRKPNAKVSESEKEAIKIIDAVEMIHLTGDKENRTGGLSAASLEHAKRLRGLNADDVSLEEAMKAYDAMRNHVPRY